jgi:SAM-dependent methyltransferase/protein tyrosine phosphatase (PTP) superfamily phosphohydrolase (DUF442 family)
MNKSLHLRRPNRFLSDWLGLLFPAVLVAICLVPNSTAAQQAKTENQARPVSKQIEPVELGETKNVHRIGDLFLSGQFTEEDIEEIRKAGINRVITLRTEGEVDWDEKQAIESAGLEFEAASFRKPESLTDEVFDRVCVLLKDRKGRTLLHCGSANRVGAVWLVHRVLEENVDLETAKAEAKKIGLKTPGYEERAIAYIRLKQGKPAEPPTEDSVRPGINSNFLSPDLNPDDFVKRFEIESREVYSARMEVLKACGVKPGQTVADIGAGTGLYTRLFANEVGPEGWVYAVDISPRLIQHIMDKAKAIELANITGVLCPEDSVSLPPNSIDLAFVCDTYHHFEFPSSTLRSILSSLKPGGQFIVIDFKRIEGVTRPWLMEHVRAGQEVFQSEIEEAGFELIGEEEIPGFEENYFLRFRKSE